MIQIEIHKAKEIIGLLNELAQIILTLEFTKELKTQMLGKIDDIKNILSEAKLKEG
jgi:hypothetical protein